MDPQFYWLADGHGFLSGHADDIVVALRASEKKVQMGKINQLLSIRWEERFDKHNWCKYLDRLWRRGGRGFEARVDGKQYSNLTQELGLEQKSNTRVAIGIAAQELRDDDSALLFERQAFAYRSSVGRLIWIAPLRPDLA